MRVKIKTWKEMEKEFGLNQNDVIATVYPFTRSMEFDMPRDRVINITDDNRWSWYRVSNDMIEEVLS